MEIVSDDAVLQDPWQARLDRIRLILPLPLLAVSAVVSMAAPTGPHSWARFFVGVPVVLAAAAWWTFVTVRFRGDPTTGWAPAVLGVHTVLAGVLVWVNTAYGVFAYTGFLFAYGLGRRWRVVGFAATALVVSAALSGGYPSKHAGATLSYFLIAGILLALVFNTASITVRVVEQNQDRGRIIDELAEAKRRLEASSAENAELHVRLVEQAREAGVVEERRRLAGEIHDTLAQGLTGIIAQIQAAEHTRHRPDELSRHLAQAEALARSSLTEARRSVRALRPEQLEDASLPEAISTLVRTWAEQSMIAADLDTTGNPVRADADIEAAVFRVAQESLSNVAKHARATRAHLTLTYLDDTLLLDVVDDGIGFDTSADVDGYGLLGMNQRLSRIRGTLTIESTPGMGTIVNAAVPLSTTHIKAASQSQPGARSPQPAARSPQPKNEPRRMSTDK